MDIQSVITALTPVLGERLTQSKPDLELHGASESYFPLSPPDAVAYPETTEEVAQIVAVCAEQGCPVVGWGTGTSLEGQSQAVRGGLCVDFQRMNKVLELAAEDMYVRVQPGVTREALNAELRATGLFFPVDPGANASLGGMASTRASGTTAVRYGTMRDNVLGLEVVTASSEVIRTGSKARKSAAGYDLTGLIVGSEGTLGLITELTLRLHGQPEALSGAVCAFETVHAAVEAVIATIQMGIPIARIELMDTASVIAVNAHAGMGLPEKPHLLVEFHGSAAGVAEQAESFGAIADENGGSGFDWAQRPEDRRRLWAMRHNAYYSVLAAFPGKRAIVTDICVPISKLAEAIDATIADLEESDIAGPIVGHVGDGNFHATLMVDLADAAETARAHALAHRMVRRSLELGGTCTGEHGIGRGKVKYMQEEHGAGWAMMGRIKAALDPQGIMNPGKMLPPGN